MALIGRKTVAGVMSAFTKTIADLDTVATNNDSIVSNLLVEREKLEANMNEATSEAESARAIASKLRDIIDA